VKMRFSKSKLRHYKICPRFFYIRYFTIHGLQSGESDAVRFGSLLHKYFEAYNKNDEKDLEYYLRKDARAERHIENFKKILRLYGLDRAVYSELKEYDEELDLVGVVDAIYEKDGEYWLIDYKTGKFNKRRINDYLFELYLYVILIERKLGIKISRIGMFFTNHIYNSFVRPVREREKLQYFKEFIELKKEILEGNFERRRSGFCNYCEFVAICDEYHDEVVG